MSELIPACQSLSANVNELLELWQQEPNLKFQQDITAIATSLEKATSPKFEIVFAGAFSAGKSMLINALLERELLYSAEGHATGTQCDIEYAPADQERVVLTFLSWAEIQEQIFRICLELGFETQSLAGDSVLQGIRDNCQRILADEGGESKSERAKQAKALALLLEGYQNNHERIHQTQNAIYSMEQFNFDNLAEAASFARRGSNSSVLKRLQYYCNHPLLEDGNVLVDMPGIDAPVKRDAQLTYDKIVHPDTSAVVFVC